MPWLPPLGDGIPNLPRLPTMFNQSDTTHTHYDIRRTGYWDATSLDRELDRVYDICAGCRLCWNLCPSFPALFGALDAQPDAPGEGGKLGADVTALTESERWRVVDLCYQCKLCEARCPYTPDQGHEFLLDFPRLMLRAQAQRTRSRGKQRSDVFLGNPDATGRVGTALAPLSNLANRVGPFRFLLDKLVGISRHRVLPTFHRRTFARWYRKHAKNVRPNPEPAGRVVVFATCYTNANDPGVGRAAVEVLEHNDVEVQVASQRCCGAPHLSPGDFDAFRAQALPNVEELAGWVDRGYQIVVTGPPTCSLTLRQDYSYLSDGDPRMSEMIAKVAGHTLDISQYLMQLHKEGKLKTDFANELGEINYHLSCHLKAQKAGFKSRDLLRLVPGTKVVMVEKCSGMDGGWGMKSENFTESMKVAAKLVSALNQHPAPTTCSDCTLAGMQVRQATGGAIAPRHPVTMIHHAYGLDARA